MRRALVIGIACILALFVATPAFADAPDIDRLFVNVRVLPSTSLQVVEQQTVTLPSNATSYSWTLYANDSDDSEGPLPFVVGKVSVVAVDKDGLTIGTPIALVNSDPFDDNFVGPIPETQDAAAEEKDEGNENTPTENDGAPAETQQESDAPLPSFSFDRDTGKMHCTFPEGIGSTASQSQAPGTSPDGADATASESMPDSSDTVTILIQTEYTVVHHMDLYRDVAELYWRYVNTDLPYVQDASLTVQLPAPESALPTLPGKDVMAWGHGPGHGSFAVQPDGTVTYHVAQAPSQNYAEAHIIFPVSWVDTSRDPLRQYSEMRRAAVVAREENWVDSATRGLLWDDRVRMLFLAIAFVIILPGVAGVIRNGYSPRARLSLVRVSTTLGIITLGELLFFHEPLTSVLLAAITLIVSATSVMLPATEAEAEAILAADAEEAGEVLEEDQ